jgi:hypothetical protein
MVRMANLSEEELLEKEVDWWEREDETKLSWISVKYRDCSFVFKNEAKEPSLCFSKKGFSYSY